MAGKSWQVSHELPHRREGRHLSHCVNRGKEGGKWREGGGLEDQVPWNCYANNTLAPVNAKHTLQSKSTWDLAHAHV